MTSSFVHTRRFTDDLKQVVFQIVVPAFLVRCPSQRNHRAGVLVPLDDMQIELSTSAGLGWRYDLAAQATSNRQSTLIEDGACFDGVTVTTNGMGVLTVVLQTAVLEAPVYTIFTWRTSLMKQFVEIHHK